MGRLSRFARISLLVLLATILIAIFSVARGETSVEIADDKFLEEVAMVESGGDPNAVSHAGAQGKYQIMPHTAKDPGFGVEPIDNPFNPQKAKRFARDYWNALFEACNMNYECAVLSYNWGIGNYKKWVRNGRPMSMIPDEARGYLAMLGDDAREALKRYRERIQREKKEEQKKNRRIQKLAQLQKNPHIVVGVDGTGVSLQNETDRKRMESYAHSFSVWKGQLLVYRREKVWLQIS